MIDLSVAMRCTQYSIFAVACIGLVVGLVVGLVALCGGFSSRARTSFGPLPQYSNAYTGHFLAWPLPRPVISEWDAVVRHAADGAGYDWRMISAIVRAESQFDPNVRSYAGAVGLMQVMPVVARSFGVDPALLRDPVVNVSLGVALLQQMEGTMRFPREISERNRWSILLAAYNCGLGHVLDARRLAAKYGEKHNSWDVVAKYLILKGLQLYYDDEAVRNGPFGGSVQTLGFVNKVMGYYADYSEFATK